jgi:hypothetical protein
MDLELVIRAWVVGSVLLIKTALFWCWQHRHLDGQPIGPLKRVFCLRRVAFLMPMLLMTVYSVFIWAIYLTPGFYRVLVPVVGMAVFAVFAVFWNRHIRRLQEQMADTQE